jgi:hypothetical protein
MSVLNRNKFFYHPERGYWESIGIPSEGTLAKYPDGTIEVTQRPSVLHTYVNGDWQAPSQEEFDAYEAKNVRNERSIILALEVDPVVSNPLRWASMSAEEQQAWADYRQALLDIPDQEGFPHNVTWPTKPSA